MYLQKRRDLAECFLGLRDERSEKLCVALPLEHPEAGVDASLNELPMGQDSVAQKQVSRTGGQYRWRKATEIAIDR